MESGTVGDLCGIEDSLLECVPEAVDVEKNAALLRLRDQLAELTAYWLDLFDRPFALSHRGEREAFGVGRRQPHAGDAERAAVRAVPGLGAATIDGLAGCGREHGRVRRDPRAVELRSLAGDQAGAAAERQRAAGHAERAQERTS